VEYQRIAFVPDHDVVEARFVDLALERGMDPGNPFDDPTVVGIHVDELTHVEPVADLDLVDQVVSPRHTLHQA